MKRIPIAVVNLAVITAFAVIPFAGGHAGFLLGFYALYAGEGVSLLIMASFALLIFASIARSSPATVMWRAVGILLLLAIWACFLTIGEWKGLTLICSIPFLILCALSANQLVRQFRESWH